MKLIKSERGFAEIGLLVVLLVVLAGAGFYVYQRKQAATQPTAPQATRSSRVATALNFSPALTPQGAVATTASTFAPSTPSIYAVASLKAAPKNARIEYTRYRDGKYVDNGSMAVNKDNASNASFAWSLKPGTTHPAGAYKVKVYVNGKYQRGGTYTVK